MDDLLGAVGVLTLAHEDTRRRIEEYNGSDFSVQLFEIYTEIPLGNHYHKRKTETFIILVGGGRLLLQHMSGGVVEEKRLARGDVIRMSPLVAHTFFLTPGSQMVCYSSVPFDPNDMDMHPHPLT